MDFGSKLLGKRVQVLGAIKKLEGTNVSKLVNNKEVEPTSYLGMKKIVVSLLEMGFIEHAPSNKREKNFTITKKGKEFLKFMEK